MDEKTTWVLVFFMVTGFFAVLLFAAAWLEDRDEREAAQLAAQREAWFAEAAQGLTQKQARHPERKETYNLARQVRTGTVPYKIEAELEPEYDPRKSFGRN